MNNNKMSDSYAGRKKQTSSERKILEKIVSSQTRISDTKDQGYNVDGCACPSCGCVEDDFVIILSPAGVAGAGVAYVVSAPF